MGPGRLSRLSAYICKVWFKQAIPAKLVLKDLGAEFHNEAVSIMDFWQNHMLDKANGGFYGLMDADFRVHPEHDKALVMNMRGLWTFSALARLMKNKGYLAHADGFFQFVSEKFYDKEAGGFFWNISHTGTPLDTNKQVYGQLLAIYALAEYHIVSGSEEALSMAKSTFNLIEIHCLDRAGRAYINSFDRNWKALDDFRMLKGEMNAPIHVGVQLHAIEALTVLYQCEHSEKILNRLLDLQRLFHEKMIDPGSRHLYLYVNEDYTSVSDETRYGHDVEYAWLALDAAEITGDKMLLAETIRTSLEVIDKVRSKCSRRMVIYETKVVRGKKITLRRWWDQAEMMLGLWYAFRYSGEEQYLRDLQKTWSFVKHKLHNKTYGEWNYNSRSARRGYRGYMAGPWKAPYHSGRAMGFLTTQIGDYMSSS